jgi:hypothetical protein
MLTVISGNRQMCGTAWPLLSKNQEICIVESPLSELAFFDADF